MASGYVKILVKEDGVHFCDGPFGAEWSNHVVRLKWYEKCLRVLGKDILDEIGEEAGLSKREN